jgi:hypothetical protein
MSAEIGTLLLVAIGIGGVVLIVLIVKANNRAAAQKRREELLSKYKNPEIVEANHQRNGVAGPNRRSATGFVRSAFCR